jgi:hypothetical protein
MRDHTMAKIHTSIVISALFAILVISSCSTNQPAEPVTQDPADIATKVAQTVGAELTSIALDATPTAIPPTATSTPTDIPPTLTLTPLPTPVPTATPTATPLPTATPTPIPLPCDAVDFLTDISIKDGTVLRPGSKFTKTWRLENVGTCNWTAAYDLVFVSGDRLSGEPVMSLPSVVRPGETVDLSVDLNAPKEAGRYRGLWQLRNEGGVLFGIGNTYQDSFWVDIQVQEPYRKSIFNFAESFCNAVWESGSGELACPSKPSDPNGFVVFLEDPKLENRNENEPTIWTQPNQANNGWISGTFPPELLEEGDRFRAWVGCLAESSGCNVEFQLDYQKASGGPIKNLGTWRETLDGEVSKINLSLSDLAGQRVLFILSVTVRENPESAQAFWFMPHIDRVEGIE